MIVFKCDRCGSIFWLTRPDSPEKDLPNTLKKCVEYLDGTKANEANEERFNLCDFCMEEFEKWMENPDDESDEDAAEESDEDADEIYRLEHVFDDDYEDYEDDEFDNWIEWARNSLVDHALTDIKKKKERKRNG